jgi:hypothetical protein
MKRSFAEGEERRRELEKMMTTPHEPEVLPPSLVEEAETIVREFNALKPEREEFLRRGVFSAAEMKGDFLETKRKAEARSEDIGEREIPNLAEAVVAIASVEGDWLGKGVTVVATTPYDDHRGVDYIYELRRPNGEILRFAVDVTTATFPHEGPPPDDTVQEKETGIDAMRKKVGALLRPCLEGRFPATVKYFSSEAEPERIGRIELPKVILAFSPRQIFTLAEIHARTRAHRNDQEAARLLREHPLRREFLAQISLGLRAIEGAMRAAATVKREKRAHPHSKGKSRRLPAQSSEESLEMLEKLREALKELGAKGNVSNELLKDAYVFVIEDILRTPFARQKSALLE